MKRIIVLALILFVIASAIFLLFFLGRGEDGADVGGGGTLPPPLPGTPPSEGTHGAIVDNLPDDARPAFAAKDDVVLVSNSRVLSYFVDKDQSILLVSPDGEVLKISDKGAATTLNATKIAGLRAARFSRGGARVLVAFGNVHAPEQSMFDVSTKKWQPLPASFEHASWSPQGDSLAYFTTRNSRKVLETLPASALSSSPKELLRFRAQDLLLHWASPDTIYLYDKPGDSFGGSLSRYDLSAKRLTLILEDQAGLEILWNASGTRGLAHRANPPEGGGPLLLLDEKGLVTNELNILTLASKCGFGAVPQTVRAATSTATINKEFLFCAVPRENTLPAVGELLDAYYKQTIFTVDDLYSVNLDGGATKSVFSKPDTRFDAHALSVARGRLFFINRYDQKLYAVTLKE